MPIRRRSMPRWRATPAGRSLLATQTTTGPRAGPDTSGRPSRNLACWARAGGSQGGAGRVPTDGTETGAGPRGETGPIVADPREWGDVVLARKDTPTSYHLSVVVDDALQGITHVVRGWDLFAATGLHRLLQILLELPQPIYHHHRLILDAQGRKLSKSARATGLRELRAGGAAPTEILSMIGLG